MALATNGKMVSKRHQIASQTKLTAGESVKMLKKLGIPTNAKEVVEVYALINGRHPEWHHSGFYKSGGKSTMGRTYFFTIDQIQTLAKDWEKQAEVKQMKAARQLEAKERQERQNAYLHANAKKVVRSATRPMFFVETAREMQGKHGWFDSYGKTYNLPEYYSGWELSEEQFRIYVAI
jgi:hypothetical protein